MAIHFPEIEDIYFEKTKTYFDEVISSYANCNYRSAIVMLYSVAICDMLFKLQELKDMFNDTIAEEILKEVDKSRNEHDNKSKSRWEKEFVDNIYNKTKLLDLEGYTNLNHLYDYRNFSAHPALNENYELIAPSKETTVACIKNTLKDILTKPPIFIKNIIEMMTEDLKGKGDLYVNADDKLVVYLNNKYLSKMPNSMKLATLKAFWKFCFCLPDNTDCMNNLAINRKALGILIDGFEKEAYEYIKANNNLFSVAPNENCLINLVVLLSIFPSIYTVLNEDTKLQVDSFVEKDTRAKSIAWFKYPSCSEHFYALKEVRYLTLDTSSINRMSYYYSTYGELSALIDFFIWYYGESRSYDSADNRFAYAIAPFIEQMSATQIQSLIEVSNANRQIWDRGAAYSANNIVAQAAKKLLGDDFDYTRYTHFKFDAKIMNPNASDDDQQQDKNVEWPF